MYSHTTGSETVNLATPFVSCLEQTRRLATSSRPNPLRLYRLEPRSSGKAIKRGRYSTCWKG